MANAIDRSSKLPGWRYEEIKDAASKLLTRLDIHSFPIDPMAIAQKMRLELRAYSTLPSDSRSTALKVSPDGFSSRAPEGRYIICYNDTAFPSRINFTLMHEIWHVLLGHTEHGRLAELEANFAAGYTLAPPPALWASNPPAQQVDIELLCGISDQAAEYAWRRYQSWIAYHRANQPLESYEMSLIELFSVHKNGGMRR